MLAIFAMQVFHLSTSLALCIDIFLEGPTKERAEDWWGPVTMNALLLAFMVFDAFSLILLVQLVWFHLGLQREQITTYQYIIRDHQKRREQNRLQRELDNQRAVALRKAQADGRTVERLRLMWGETSRKMGCGDFCDPLKMPTEVNEETGFATALGTANGVRGTTSDGDEDEDDEEAGQRVALEDDNDEPVVAEQALAPTAEDTRTAEERGPTFLSVRSGEDIMAEPGAYNPESEENGDSRQWEFPSSEHSNAQKNDEIPEVDVYVSADEASFLERDSEPTSVQNEH